MDGGHDGKEKITVDSLLLKMPASRAKRSRAAASFDDSSGGPPIVKRARLSDLPHLQQPITIPDSDDLLSLFGDDEDDIEVYDLTRSEDELPEELLKSEEDDSVKLSKFECIICMDAATNLTVTHCGRSSYT